MSARKFTIHMLHPAEFEELFNGPYLCEGGCGKEFNYSGEWCDECATAYARKLRAWNAGEPIHPGERRAS